MSRSPPQEEVGQSHLSRYKSELIRGHQWSSVVIRGYHQRSSEVIRGHQKSSEVISNLGPGGRVRSPRVRLGVDLGGRGRGRRGGVFPKTTLDFLDSLQTRPDPNRPRPRSPIFMSYPPTRPPPTRPHTGEWRRAVLGAFHIVRHVVLGAFFIAG